jgi:hypothetical protein
MIAVLGLWRGNLRGKKNIFSLTEHSKQKTENHFSGEKIALSP